MTTELPTRPHSVLFLCTGNSARSQMAEALMNRRARGRFVASSAGSRPAARVNPFAIQALREVGIEWNGHTPRAFTSARTLIARRIDLMLALPIEKLQRVTLGQRLDEIAADTVPARRM